MNVFFTYVYASHGKDDLEGAVKKIGWPLTFSSKSGRSMARNMVKEGDIVFGVVSSSPGHDVIVPEEFKGRVKSAWQVTRQNALLTDYKVNATDWDLQWPYALQPIRTWEILDAPLFRELDGYDAKTHTLKSVSSVEHVNEELAGSLLGIMKAQGNEIPMAEFRFTSMQQRNLALRQKHPVRIEGYSVEPIDSDELNYVYIATLGKGTKNLKIGHSSTPNERVEHFNKYRLSDEKQWQLHTAQPMGSVQNAVKAEATLGEVFAKFRTEVNNNEIYVGLDAMDVLARLATMRG
ncbi:T5orf172 domain-containing protein [Litoreibacter ascidiaceicola]|uniref:T5orf172 domain-containing protein n=1 Tax=Litoreibacter ascidiaceicola TaxID=1486859 RepID=A0A1M4SBC6_9RHOB|nr:GIY-YIG nuclease family protein [Litoreibacter ascidiaceicola]SHE29499.1 T5orf172 domain-containing protein [Litoreibacter ascidiaceicola]